MSTSEQQTQLTQAVMALLDEWQLGVDEMQQLLLLPSNVRARAFQNSVKVTRPSLMRKIPYAVRITCYALRMR